MYFDDFLCIYHSRQAQMNLLEIFAMANQCTPTAGAYLQWASAVSCKIYFFNIKMPSIRVVTELKDQPHFVTLTVNNWVHFFDKYGRFEILEDNFVHCQKNKGLKIYSFVFMPNHLHFIGSAPNLGGVIRDIKKYLSKEFKRNMELYEPHALKQFMNKGKYSFWKSTNCPKVIESDFFYCQKMDYIHYNPVKKGYVEYEEDWKWSSVSRVSTRIKVEEEMD